MHRYKHVALQLYSKRKGYNYRPCLREGNVLVLSVYLSVCLSVRAIIFECLDVETSFWYVGPNLTISRPSLSINGHKVKVKVTLVKWGFPTAGHNSKLTEVRWSVTRCAFLRHLVGSM